MLFNSVEYFLFLAFVVAAFWAIPGRHRPLLIVAASVIFYGFRDWRLPLLLLSTVALTYGAARWMPRLERRARRWVLAGAVLAPLVVLGLFKSVFNTTTPQGLVIVPAGISFYTFVAISYLVDVYRGTTEPERDPVVLSAYISFFPALLAGPITRSHRLIPQLRRVRPAIRSTQFYEGLELLFVGLFKKVAIADVLLQSAQTYQGGTPGSTQTVSFWLGGVSIVQVIIGGYFDLSGYVDMARGSAKLIGIELPQNFAQPLTRSANFTEFWRRWQITLMGWLRDYVFMPLRGSTRSPWRIFGGLTVVFLLVAVWHGVAVGWLLFGVVTSALITGERRYNQIMAARRAAGRAKPRPRRGNRVAAFKRILWVWFCILLTQGVVVVGATLAPFGSEAPSTATTVDYSFDPGVLYLLGYAVVMLVVMDRFDRRQRSRETKPNPPTLVRSAAFGAMLVGIILFSGTPVRDVVYFGF